MLPEVTTVDETVQFVRWAADKFKKTSDKPRHFDSLAVASGTAARPTADLTAKCGELGVGCDVIGDAKKVRMGLDATADAYGGACRI